MLRKLIVFAITSGLAKKAWDAYRARQLNTAPVQKAPRPPTHQRATTVGPGGDLGADPRRVVPLSTASNAS